MYQVRGSLQLTPHTAMRLTVGASLLAKNPRAPRSFRMRALSLTFFASKLAPTGSYQAWTFRPYSAAASCNHNHQ
ncbi:hypothetical protein FJD34_22605 [Pseudomonas brenneri]|uniref:Uncharacterized protein n=1 Tax=Pseudomonas brenneri TaxID=129817 RepID=A0A5B2V1S1_9PSED|nr:hypothetical protein F1720_05150 [Pseudomonas brenneri]TWR75794.1 hypothetical protein FJD34_22605 [Pseudomonas brenneri]